MEMEFDDFIAEVRLRKMVLGITEADFDGTENSGMQRTPDKRRSLASSKARALEAGIEPLPANF